MNENAGLKTDGWGTDAGLQADKKWAFAKTQNVWMYQYGKTRM